MEPLTMSALISGGSQLGGQLLTGIGSGLAAAREEELAREQEERRRMEADRDFREGRRQFDVSHRLRGIDMLAQMRNSAIQDNRRRMFRDQLLSGLGV